jgi:hypothetical protein
MTLQLSVVKKLIPKHQRSLLTQEYLDTIEASVKDSLVADAFKENFLTYAKVLASGRYKLEDYINAVKYISYKLLKFTNVEAYAATFPERFERLTKEKQPQIDAYVSMYNSNKLVGQIYEQTLVPTYVLNAPLHQEVITELARMVQDHEVRGMVKVKACEVILQYTKPPEKIEGKLTIGIEQQETIADLNKVVGDLADTYRALLENGTKSVKEIIEADIVTTDYEEVDEFDD